MGDHNTCNLRQLLSCGLSQGVLSRIKKDVGHINDQSSGGISSFQDQIKLVGQEGSTLCFIALSLEPI